LPPPPVEAFAATAVPPEAGRPIRPCAAPVRPPDIASIIPPPLCFFRPPPLIGLTFFADSPSILNNGDSADIIYIFPIYFFMAILLWQFFYGINSFMALILLKKKCEKLD
jgi:hypothetical protein